MSHAPSKMSTLTIIVDVPITEERNNRYLRYDSRWELSSQRKPLSPLAWNPSRSRCPISRRLRNTPLHAFTLYLPDSLSQRRTYCQPFVQLTVGRSKVNFTKVYSKRRVIELMELEKTIVLFQGLARRTSA